MAVVYFNIPVENLEDVIDCGLKLSEWKERQQATPWCGFERPCFSALLHPHDDSGYKNSALKCIKLDVPTEYLAVADKDLYHLSREYPDVLNDYLNTMVPLDKYYFGSFRLPECLVFTTVLPDQISRLGKGMDEPILYEDSETLYVNNLLQMYNDRYDDVNPVLLYSFLTLQEQRGIIECLRSEEKGLAAFFDREKNRHITVPVPDFSKYHLY